MKLYLDMCCLKRPFDDQADARIQLETLALVSLLQLCRDGHQELITSAALHFENLRNPNPERQQAAEVLLALAVQDVPHSSAVEQRAQPWQEVGITLLDALHLASAELAPADRFATVDDVLLDRAGRRTTPLRIVSLLDLAQGVASMNLKLPSVPELNRRAFVILSRELGVPNALRFFSQLGLGGGNYTEERRSLFAALTLDEYRQVVGQSSPPASTPTQLP